MRFCTDFRIESRSLIFIDFAFPASDKNGQIKLVDTNNSNAIFLHTNFLFIFDTTLLIFLYKVVMKVYMVIKIFFQQQDLIKRNANIDNYFPE